MIPRPEQSYEEAIGSSIALWKVVTLYAALSIVLFDLTELHSPSDIMATDGVVFLGSICSFGLLRLIRPNRAIMMLSAISQYGVFGLATILAVYACATSEMPLIDATLAQLDQQIGYDWLVYAKFVNRTPVVHDVLSAGYLSFRLQPLIAIGLLICLRKIEQANEYVLRTMIAMILTLALFYAFPATTAWTHQNVPIVDVHALDLPNASRGWIRSLLDIRGGETSIGLLNEDPGLIGFPSFHMVLALLNIRAFWGIGFMRMPMTAVNLLMIAGTPIFGGHYVMDLFGGAAVTCVSVLLAKPLHTWLIVAEMRRAADRPEDALPSARGKLAASGR